MKKFISKVVYILIKLFCFPWKASEEFCDFKSSIVSGWIIYSIIFSMATFGIVFLVFPELEAFPYIIISSFGSFIFTVGYSTIASGLVKG